MVEIEIDSKVEDLQRYEKTNKVIIESHDGGRIAIIVGSEANITLDDMYINYMSNKTVRGITETRIVLNREYGEA